jgi:Domain of unknown function (DUF1996)
MTRCWQALTLSLVVAVSLVAAGTGTAGGLGTAVQAGGARTGHGGGGGGALYFAVACGFSHRNQDDPIVHARHPGMSHDHTFFSNTSTDAFSTVASLRQSGTTCNIRFDTAAYWVPTLFVNGNPVRPTGATIYYVRRTVDPVRAFPAGLKVVAGNAQARSPQSSRVTAWSCGSLRDTSSSVPTCADELGFGRFGKRGGLQLLINFPSCWNGRTLDSADHQSHMAYAANGVCPASHPVEVPGLLFAVRYPVAGGPNVELASGGQFSGHGDFFNAWNQSVLEGLVGRYLNRFR